ncbi:MAG TPA: molybdopterin cofactor-binding domain-containing protein, partial [Telluria sp.]
MKFTEPATTNPIDQLKVVGRPTDRIDGPYKTTGTAPYAYEQHQAAPNAAVGYIVGAAIGCGTIKKIDTAAARAAPGVLAVVTYENAGKLGKGSKNTARLLAGPEVQHYHQAVAVVVAETFEQARAAAYLVQVDYAPRQGVYDLEAAMNAAGPAKKAKDKSTTRVGDFDGAFATAPVKLDATYITPDQSHMMMEPHASLAIWEGDKLTLYTSNQMIHWGKEDMARTLGIPEENVRLVSP